MPVDAPLKAGRRMRHLIHRHEPPVPDTPIQVSSRHMQSYLVRKEIMSLEESSVAKIWIVGSTI